MIIEISLRTSPNYYYEGRFLKGRRFNYSLLLDSTPKNLSIINFINNPKNSVNSLCIQIYFEVSKL